MKHQRVVTGTIVAPVKIELREWIGAVGVIPFLMSIVGAHRPVLIESVLYTGSGVDVVGCLVAWVDIGRRTAIDSPVDGLERSGPSILGEIAIEHSEAGANHGLFAIAGRVGDSQARRELLAVIVRNRGGNSV